MTSPHTLADRQYDFWADAAADAVEERVEAGEEIVIKGGISPSGVPHFGNMNELMRGHFVAEVLRERGHDVRQVFTTDDRDPLRKLPRKLADLDGNIVGLGEVDASALGTNLGRPYTDIPDPFGCCDSYGDHFSEIIRQSADLLGIDLDIRSNTDLYESGAFEDVTRHILAHADEAREILGEYQDKVDASYVPFNPICAECGTVTETVTSIDAAAGTVEYRCTDIEAGGQTIEGCGHEGTATLRKGKLPWRFEWPAQWQTLDVDFEPFGKDHAEGSWPSGEHIARSLLGNEPPVPMVYEWFTLNGEAFSSSAGNVVMVSEVLELLEPEVVRYFFTKDPKRARDFSIERLDQLVDEFDRFERLYFGEEDGGETETARAERAYPFVTDPDAARIRIPYTFAAVLGMTDDDELRATMARRSGHLPEDASDEQVERALGRVEKARAWAVRTDNEYNYRLAEELPEVAFDDATTNALADLADYVETERPDGETLHEEIFETARDHGVEVGDFFTAGYRLFLDEQQGPRLGPFLAALDRTFVTERLRLRE
ncbi:lysine--tRNA ligase [Halosegnis rubeus]|jgi:lysyl-tRNA synthetase class 1|uniref:Lysine--tRNA ligase n=1 Tax=Halosegnis rubeus TaxID=2212850 RepID=A0A5N5UL59_9EURY|nr:lysine--tRNA ligase [Halosegnis rubeus]KAB7519528.1 lysine--tRNA ligase [Halosegnis rubeus]